MANPIGTIDAKAAAGTVGGALSMIIWILLAAFVAPIGDLGAEVLAALIGASGTVLTAALAYLTPNAASPTKSDGVNIERSIEEMVER